MQQWKMSTSPSRTCDHCGTEYEVPEGKVARAEMFLNIPPSAHLIAWAFEPGQRTPTIVDGYVVDPVLHECKRGKRII